MTLKTTYRTLAVLGICSALLTGCKKEEGSAAGDGSSPALAINASCPIMPENGVSLKAPTVQYNGMTIGFCCAECVDKWNAWPDSKKAEFIAAEKKAKAGNMPENPAGNPDH